MYFLNNFCCICMNKSDLKPMFDVDNDGVSHYNKLTSSVAEMTFKEMNHQRLICGECCVTLNTVYNFRQTCLRSKTNLVTYISQLQTYGKVSGTLSVLLEDIKQETIVVKEEIHIKCENEDSSFEENNPQREFQTKNNEDSIEFPASVKQECENEDDSSAHEDATADYENEDAYGDANVKVENQPMVEHIYFTKFSSIVKEEPVSDSETAQDGSTSQGTSVEPKESEETTTGTKVAVKVKKRPYKCDICERCFDRRRTLNNHILTHSSERPYECEVCKRCFNQKEYLKRHSVVHTGDKPYECETCKKRFYSRGLLNVHTVIHSGENPYECEICKKRFNQKAYLRKHSRIHSGVKRYECEICKKRFFYKGNVTAHMEIHTERAYGCEICERRFKQKTYLKKHMLTHSERSTKKS